MSKPSLLLLLCSLCLSLATQAREIVMASDVWFPVSGQPGSDKPGYMVEIATQALALHQHKVIYKVIPWGRAIEQTRKGEIDCVLGAQYEDAPDFVFGEENLGADAAHLFVRANDPWRYNGLASLENKVIGTITGYAYHPSIDAWLNRHGVAISGDEPLPRNIQKLILERLDAVIAFSIVMRARLAEMGLAEKVISAGSVSDAEAIYIACSPNKEDVNEIIKLLDQGIRELRNKGLISLIMKKYGLSDWK